MQYQPEEFRKKYFRISQRQFTVPFAIFARNKAAFPATHPTGTQGNDFSAVWE